MVNKCKTIQPRHTVAAVIAGRSVPNVVRRKEYIVVYVNSDYSSLIGYQLDVVVRMMLCSHTENPSADQ